MMMWRPVVAGIERDGDRPDAVQGGASCPSREMNREGTVGRGEGRKGGRERMKANIEKEKDGSVGG